MISWIDIKTDKLSTQEYEQWRTVSPKRKKMIVLGNEITLPIMTEEILNEEHDDNNENVTETGLDHTKRENEKSQSPHPQIWCRNVNIWYTGILMKIKKKLIRIYWIR